MTPLPENMMGPDMGMGQTSASTPLPGPAPQIGSPPTQEAPVEGAEGGLPDPTSSDKVGKILFEDFFPPLDVSDEQEKSLAEWFIRDLKSCVRHVNSMRDKWATWRAVYMLEYVDKFYPTLGMGAEFSSGELCEKVIEGMDRLRKSVLSPRPLFVVDDKTSNMEDIELIHRVEWFMHTLFTSDLKVKKILGLQAFFEFLLDGSFILGIDQMYEKIPQRTIRTYATVDELMMDEAKVVNRSDFDEALEVLEAGEMSRLLIEEDTLTKNGMQIFPIDKVDHLIPPRVYTDHELKFRARRMYLTKNDLRLLASDNVNWYDPLKVEAAIAKRNELRASYRGMRQGEGDNDSFAAERLTRESVGELAYDWRHEEDRLSADASTVPYEDTFTVYRIVCKYGYKTGGDEKGEIPKYCLTGDTLIHTASGDFPIKTLVGTKPVVFGYDKKKERMAATRASGVVKVGTREVIKVSYEWWSPTGGDRSGFIEITPDHKVLLRSGVYVEAGDLSVGDSLMPFTTADVLGYRQVWLNNPLKARTPVHLLVHTDMKGVVTWDHCVHHIDGDKQNNDPDNLVSLSESDHIKMHGIERGKAFKAWWATMSKEERSAVATESNIKAYKRGRKNALQEMWDKLTPEERSRRASQQNKKAYAEGHRDRKFKGNQYVKVGNHTVTGIEWGGKVVDVYDMEVPRVHNFAAAGIVVHNCLFDFEPESRLILRPRTYPHFEERPDYFHFKLGHAPKSYWGFGFGARLINEDSLESNAVCLYMDGAALSTYHPMLTTHPEEGGYMPFIGGYGPGKIGYVKNPQTDVKWDEIPAPPMGLIQQIVPLAKTRAENRTGITSLTQGRTESSDPRSPAAKTGMLLREASISLDSIVEDWDTTGWEPLAAFVWMAAGEILVYEGKDAFENKIEFSGVAPDLEKVNVISAVELRKKIQWVSQASADFLNADLREQKFLKQFQFFAPQLQVLGQINPELFKKYFLRWMRWAAMEMNIRSFRYLIPTEEELARATPDQLMGAMSGTMEQLKTGQSPSRVEVQGGQDAKPRGQQPRPPSGR